MCLWDKAVESLKDKHKHNVDFQRTDKHAILSDILAEIQKKKQACIERKLKYKRKNGEFVVLYDVYEKMVKWVTKFKEVGDIAMQYDPGHAALPWAAIRFFLQVSVNDVQIFGSLAEGLEVVSKIVARYAAIERLYLRQSASVETSLENSIIELYASILVFFSKCRKFFDLGLAQRLARSITQAPEQIASKYLEKIAVNDGNVKELTRIIDAERAQLFGVQQSSMTDKVDVLGNDIETLQKGARESAYKLEALLFSFQDPLVRTVERIATLTESLTHKKTESQMKEERLKILSWLSNVQYKKHHQSVSKGLLEGTGSWLLRKPQFVEWRNSSVSSVLWLHGIPGSGKTCLMSTVIRQLLAESSACENAAPIAYFYCQRNSAESERSDPTEVLRAILRQLLCYAPRWQEASSTVKEYRKRQSEAEEDGFEISRLDIMETTNQIIEIASKMPVTILIDALDEIRSDRRHELLGTLDLLLEKSAQLVKVFVSSRDDVDIILRLQKHPNIYIGISDNKEDIHRYIQFAIQKAQSDGRLLKGTVSPELTKLITKTLAMKAEGMFLWVRLQIENLCDSRRIKIEGDLVDELARLPRSLVDMYALILENIGHIEKRGRTVAETIFKWLLCTDDARSQVTIAACSGTGSPEDRSLSIPDILDICSTLVTYDEVLDKFGFAHLSIREFFESQPGYTPSETNRGFLDRSLQTVICVQPSGDRFWSYAILCWILHYNKLEEQYRKDFFELHAKSFLFNGAGPSNAFNNWATKAHRLNLGSPFAETIEIPSQNKLSNIFSSGDFRSPVDLASCYGWLEILDYFEASQSPDDFQKAAMNVMRLAILHGQTSVMRWLFDRQFYPRNEDLELALKHKPEIVQVVVEKYVLSFNILVNSQKLLASTVRLNLGDMYQELTRKGANMNYRDGNRRTLLSHASSSSSRSDDKIIEELSLTGSNLMGKEGIGRLPLSLLIWGQNPPTFYPLLSAGSLDTPEGKGCQQVLRRVLRSYYYHTACLLVHCGPDSMFEDMNVRAVWTEILQLIATLPRHQRETSASPTSQPVKVANDPEDRMALVGQTLLSLASLFRYERAFQVLLDRGFDPTCSAICEVRKRLSTAAQMGHSISVQEPLDQEHERNFNKMSDELRQGPLAWAAYTGNLPLVQSILDRGLDPNIKNRKGQTALYFAVQQKEGKYPQNDLETDKEGIVRLLLQKGAVITTGDAYGGATILANAFEARYGRVARLLQENGAVAPKGPTNGPNGQLWFAFDQGQEQIRQALLERAQSAEVDLLGMQWSSSGRRWSGDIFDIAARLAWGGTMRVLGDVVRKICYVACSVMATPLARGPLNQFRRLVVSGQYM